VPDSAAVLAILAMAAVTYACRAGGFWLARRFKPTPFLEAWLEQLPGAVFAALVAPMVVAAGPAGWVAGGIGFGLMRWTGRFMVALLGGLGAYAALTRLAGL
jgi:uncharacterized membrane protein